jgi:hypothetical protein
VENYCSALLAWQSPKLSRNVDVTDARGGQGCRRIDEDLVSSFGSPSIDGEVDEDPACPGRWMFESRDPSPSLPGANHDLLDQILRILDIPGKGVRLRHETTTLFGEEVLEAGPSAEVGPHACSTF